MEKFPISENIKYPGFRVIFYYISRHISKYINFFKYFQNCQHLKRSKIAEYPFRRIFKNRCVVNLENTLYYHLGDLVPIGPIDSSEESGMSRVLCEFNDCLVFIKDLASNFNGSIVACGEIISFKITENRFITIVVEIVGEYRSTGLVVLENSFEYFEVVEYRKLQPLDHNQILANSIKLPYRKQNYSDYLVPPDNYLSLTNELFAVTNLCGIILDGLKECFKYLNFTNLAKLSINSLLFWYCRNIIGLLTRKKTFLITQYDFKLVKKIFEINQYFISVIFWGFFCLRIFKSVWYTEQGQKLTVNFCRCAVPRFCL